MQIEVSNTDRKRILHLIVKELRKAEKKNTTVKRLTVLYDLEKKFKAV